MGQRLLGRAGGGGQGGLGGRRDDARCEGLGGMLEWGAGDDMAQELQRTKRRWAQAGLGAWVLTAEEQLDAWSSSSHAADDAGAAQGREPELEHPGVFDGAGAGVAGEAGEAGGEEVAEEAEEAEAEWKAKCAGIGVEVVYRREALAFALNRRLWRAARVRLRREQAEHAFG